MKLIQLTMKFKLYGITLACALGLMLVLALGLWCLMTFRVNGPVYQEIEMNQNVVADVLPPPMFIIEAYLIIQEADATKSTTRLKKLQNRFITLEADYHGRYQHWKNSLPENEINKSLLQDSYVPAMRFFDIARDSYFPMRESGQHDAASAILHGALQNAFAEHRQAISKTVELAQTQTAQIEAETARRVTFWIQTMIVISLLSVIALTLLITRMRAIEEAIIQSEKMNTVAGLAAGMAHEINSPLAGVVQSAQVVLNRVSPELAANCSAAEESGTRMECIQSYLTRRGIREMLEGIRASGQRAAEIVASMVSFSQGPGAQADNSVLSELVDHTVELAQNDFDPKRPVDFRSIELVKDYDQKLSKVPCRASEIQQVLLNLLKNAAQAMADRGVRSEPPRITLRTTQIGNTARIEVEDNGPGMPRAMRRRIFEPFFTTRESLGGTGLGLFVSYFIITRNHHGTIAVESIPGVGTKFSLTLPLAGKT